jgi:fluoroquinolone resistance protein
MKKEYTEGTSFDKKDFNETPLGTGDYEYCSFTACNFSKADLSGSHFIACKFVGCNLNMAALTKTTFMDVHFKDCKMLGLFFEHCNPFGLAVTFENCSLGHSSFFGMGLKKTLFKNCMLQDVDFSECDLSSAIFDNCDLTGATFKTTILEKTDFRTSFGYSFDPQNNKVKKAKFSLSGLPGLLDRFDIDIDLNL